ncbi:hypothetical protein SO694_00028275 [Aureococcus anophagefferens]|uniref:Uncharacterized protein n=1 Tax=Aureococcus anophagefferens TaxID=44056 RepID=A0ABR1FVU0_AURAN
MRLEEDDLLSEIMAEEASEHAFLADVMGEPPTLSMPPTRLNGRRTPPSPPASKGGCWDEVLRLGASRRELGGVAAGDAERERRALEDESDAIFARLGRPVDGDGDGGGARGAAASN